MAVTPLRNAGNADSGGPSDTQVCVLPRPTGLVFCLGVRRPRRLPNRCCRSLPSAWISDEQDVADDAVWSLLRHELQHGSFHFVVAGPPSCTVSSPLRDPQHVHGIPKPTARTRAPSRAQTACQSVVGANRRGVQHCAFMGEGDFLLCSREPAWVCRPCFTWRLVSSWHRSQAPLHWKRSSTILRRAVSPVPGPEVVSNRHGDTTGVGRVQLQCSVLCLLFQLREHPPCGHCRQSPARGPCLCGPKGCGTWLDRVARQRHVQAVVLLWHGNARACS